MAAEVLQTAEALYDYAKNGDNDLPMKAGDVISVLNMDDPEWWLGQKGDALGYFPSNYVQLIEADAAAAGGDEYIEWNVGDECEAWWEEDQLWYAAVINDYVVNDDDSVEFVITYTDFGTEAKVPDYHLRPFTEDDNAEYYEDDATAKSPEDAVAGAKAFIANILLEPDKKESEAERIARTRKEEEQRMKDEARRKRAEAIALKKQLAEEERLAKLKREEEAHRKRLELQDLEHKARLKAEEEEHKLKLQREELERKKKELEEQQRLEALKEKEELARQKAEEERRKKKEKEEAERLKRMEKEEQARLKAMKKEERARLKAKEKEERLRQKAKEKEEKLRLKLEADARKAKAKELARREAELKKQEELLKKQEELKKKERELAAKRHRLIKGKPAPPPGNPPPEVSTTGTRKMSAEDKATERRNSAAMAAAAAVAVNTGAPKVAVGPVPVPHLRRRSSTSSLHNIKAGTSRAREEKDAKISKRGSITTEDIGTKTGGGHVRRLSAELGAALGGAVGGAGSTKASSKSEIEEIMIAIADLEDKFVTPPGFFAPGRRIVSQGMLFKKLKSLFKKEATYYFFLFTDLVAYASFDTGKQKFKLHRKIPIDAEFKVFDLPDHPKEKPHRFYLATSDKSFTVYAKNEQEKEGWIADMNKQATRWRQENNVEEEPDVPVAVIAERNRVAEALLEQTAHKQRLEQQQQETAEQEILRAKREALKARKEAENARREAEKFKKAKKEAERAKKEALQKANLEKAEAVRKAAQAKEEAMKKEQAKLLEEQKNKLQSQSKDYADLARRRLSQGKRGPNAAGTPIGAARSPPPNRRKHSASISLDSGLPHAMLYKSVREWSTKDVIGWLKLIDFEEYVQAFSDNKVDGELLVTLEKQDLINEMKITKSLHLKRLMQKISKLKQEDEEQKTSATSTSSPSPAKSPHARKNSEGLMGAPVKTPPANNIPGPAWRRPIAARPAPVMQYQQYPSPHGLPPQYRTQPMPGPAAVNSLDVGSGRSRAPSNSVKVVSGAYKPRTFVPPAAAMNKTVPNTGAPKMPAAFAAARAQAMRGRGGGRGGRGGGRGGGGRTGWRPRPAPVPPRPAGGQAPARPPPRPSNNAPSSSAATSSTSKASAAIAARLAKFKAKASSADSGPQKRQSIRVRAPIKPRAPPGGPKQGAKYTPTPPPGPPPKLPPQPSGSSSIAAMKARLAAFAAKPPSARPPPAKPPAAKPPVRPPPQKPSPARPAPARPYAGQKAPPVPPKSPAARLGAAPPLPPPNTSTSTDDEPEGPEQPGLPSSGGSKFCPKCGTKRATSTSRFCPNCGFKFV